MSSALLSSKIVIEEEEPRVRAIPGVSTAVTGFLGVTERGPVGVATLVTSVDEYDRIFGGYTANGFVRQAVDGFFQNAGGGAQAYVSRTVHYTDITLPSSKTSAQAFAMLLTGAVAAYGGFVEGSAAEPFNLEPGDTLEVDHDAISPTTATFNAAGAQRETAGAGPYALANNDTLLVSVDGGPVQTVTFLTSEFAAIGAATRAEVAAVINAKLSGASAVDTGTRVRITSDRRGTSSGINVSGGTGNGVLGFTTGNVAGTGNVAYIDAVTAAEVKTVVEAAVSGVTVTAVSGRVRITRNTTGPAATVQVTASSTADDELGFDNAVHAGGTGAAVNTLRVLGKTDGTYAHTIRARIQAATSGEAARFNLVVLKSGLIVETFPNLTMDANDPRYVETIVNNESNGSRFIAVEDQLAATGAASTDRPVNVTSSFLSGGDDGLTGLADTDFTGASSVSGKTGLRTFDLVSDLNLLAVPGRATSAVTNAMVTYCEIDREMSMFALLDPPAGLTAEGVITYFETTAAVLETSEFGAAYWPRIKVLNPNKSVFGNDDLIVVPPSGHIAGVMARIDARRIGGVYDPPAGSELAIIAGCLGFETNDVLEESKRDLVYPKNINPLTAQRGTGRHIDGTRVLKSNGPFPSVSERRGAIFIEQSIKDGLQFVRHRKNNEETRSQADRTVTKFLLDQLAAKAFRSQDPAKAFFVDFGDGLNTEAVQFAKKFIGRVGIATAKPIDWAILRFSQDTRALEEELAG